MRLKSWIGVGSWRVMYVLPRTSVSYYWQRHGVCLKSDLWESADFGNNLVCELEAGKTRGRSVRKESSREVPVRDGEHIKLGKTRNVVAMWAGRERRHQKRLPCDWIVCVGCCRVWKAQSLEGSVSTRLCRTRDTDFHCRCLTRGT